MSQTWCLYMYNVLEFFIDTENKLVKKILIAMIVFIFNRAKAFHKKSANNICNV